MLDTKELLEKIRDLRKYLNNLIEKKNDLLDPEIMGVSKMLDLLLNEYEKLIKAKEQEKQSII